VFKVSDNEHLIDFAPEKLTMSLYKALKHINTAESDAKHLTRTVMNKLQDLKRPILAKQVIIDTVIDVLKNYNKLSADLYRATHK
jgi:transcriptional regulator NrdR family protein